ncbi:MAG: DUF6543 domain-containing protein [Pseudomonas sp.]|uniref:dermonecrotic toxin domain-containing protein n=1 Tax=Pseudomonas sp. TaxID=306 RepID=UPI003C771B2F
MRTDTPDSAPSAVEFDDPATTPAQRLAALRTLLTRRINATAHPSRTLNQLYGASVRCAETAKTMRALLGRSPRILSVIHRALRDAFAMDPGKLLFSEPPPPRAAERVDSLIDRALALFRDPGVPINIHHFTRLSVQGEADCSLPFNAKEAMDRVVSLGLKGRIDSAVSGYWQQLAEGSALARRERWAQLHTALLADQAFLAQQLFQLSPAGYQMVKQLLDAPTLEARRQAGGDWARVRVGQVTWPHATQGVLAIPGALHLYRDGAAQSLQVIYLPGLAQAFHEFENWEQVQQRLPARVHTSLFSKLWHYLPFEHRHAAPNALQPGSAIAGDALAHSAQALLEEQWHNEWACVLSLDYAVSGAPEAVWPSRKVAGLMRFTEKGREQLVSMLPFESLLESLLDWDAQRRAPEISFASLSPDLSRSSRERLLLRYETGLEVLLDGDGEAYQAFAGLEAERRDLARNVSRWVQGSELFQKAFWLERPDATRKRASMVLNAQRQAWRREVQLQHRLTLIGQAHLDRLLEVLDTPLASARAGSDTRVVRVSVNGEADSVYPLIGVFAVTTAGALAAPQSDQPVALLVSGDFGGLAVFDSLDGLSEGLRASLASPDGSVLWRCIGRDVRGTARLALAATVTVAYTDVEYDVLYEDLKTLIEHYARLNLLLGAKTQLFSEVSDTSLASLMLAEELREQVQVPVNEARTLAMANLEFMRFAAQKASALPAWLATATVGERTHYKRLQRRYLSSAMAWENRLWQTLPPLLEFARRLLLAQLTLDGFYPGVDVDKPLLEMPDDVSAHFCGWASHCTPGDRHIKTTVSRERTTFSLLELALHNLDPQAPWTEWRLNHARFLNPAWKARLSPRYLIKTLSALDIGGKYNRLIELAFHPSNTALPRALIDRATEQLGQMQLFSALRQGLSDAAQQLFTTSMAARTAADLNQHGQHASLGFVRLCAHTLKHPRHITGILVMTDRLSPLCLVYWPTALGFPPLSEYPSWQRAREALNRGGASAENVKALSHLVAPGWEGEAMASYPGYRAHSPTWTVPLIKILPAQLAGYAVLEIYESIRRFVRTFKIKHTVAAADPQTIEAQIKEQIEAEPTEWLDIVTTSHCDASALFAHGRMLDIQQRAHARANSGATLTQHRDERLGEQWDATVRGLLSFIPVVGLGVSLYEVLLAARRFHLGGTPEHALDVAFITLMTLIDVLTSFIPGAKPSRPGVAPGRAVIRAGLRQLHRRQAVAANVLSPPQPAARLTKLLERFNTPFSTEGAVALQGPGEKGVYVRNGEQFVVDGERRYPVYRRAQEEALRVKNSAGGSEGEWVLYLREDREWLLGADAPSSPQPGPSSRIWQPFVDQTTTEWTPPSRAAVDGRMRQTLAEPYAYEPWAIPPPLILNDSLREQRIFEVSVSPQVQGYRVVEHNGRHYRVLPDGSDVSARQVMFILRNQTLQHAASLDLAYWLGAGLVDQPIPGTFGANGQWTFHRRLFNEPLNVSLIRAFPAMTANSRKFLIERLLGLSDPSKSLTATHLLRLRATLDKWLAPAAIGQTDDLLKLLRPLRSPTRTRLYIGNETTTPGFDRVDFTVSRIPAAEWRSAGQGTHAERSVWMQREVREQLERQGFIVQAVGKGPGAGASLDFSCTHPHSQNLYYVLTRWIKDPLIVFAAGRVMQLSDEWFRLKLAKNSYDGTFAPIKQAMEKKRLVKIIAGVQWTPTAPLTVFFVKFGSLKPGVVKPRLPRQKRPHSPG